jgi:hypothetical protein
MHVQEARASATPTRVHPLGPPTPSRNMILDSLPCNFNTGRFALWLFTDRHNATTTLLRA